MTEAAAPIPAKPNRNLDWLAAGAFLLVLLGCGFFLMNAGARHIEFYKALNIMLPFFTKLALLISRVLGHYWYAVILIGMTLAVAPVLLLRGRRSWPFHAWGIGAVLALSVATYAATLNGYSGLRRFLAAAGVPADAYCGSDPARLASSMSLALRSPDPRHRGFAASSLMSLAWYLRRLKAVPPEVEPALTAALGDGDARVRINAAGALWRITGNGDAARPVLLEGLKSSEREATLWIVGSFGPDAAELLPAVRELLKDDDRWVARRAQETIDRIEGRGPWARRAPK